MSVSRGASCLLISAGAAIFACGAATAQQNQSLPAPAIVSARSASTRNDSRPANGPPEASANATNSKSVGAAGKTAELAGVNPAVTAKIKEDLQIEGEKRFATNCGRCHQAPHRFPPRMMATVVRHMRVRATITDEDMRLILRYMTQ